MSKKTLFIEAREAQRSAQELVELAASTMVQSGAATNEQEALERVARELPEAYEVAYVGGAALAHVKAVSAETSERIANMREDAGKESPLMQLRLRADELVKAGEAKDSNEGFLQAAEERPELYEEFLAFSDQSLAAPSAQGAA